MRQDPANEIKVSELVTEDEPPDLPREDCQGKERNIVEYILR